MPTCPNFFSVFPIPCFWILLLMKFPTFCSCSLLLICIRPVLLLLKWYSRTTCTKTNKQIISFQDPSSTCFFCDSSSRRYISGFPLIIGHLRKNQIKWKHFKLHIFPFPWIFQGMFVLPCWMTIKNHIYSIYSMLPAFLVVIETLEIDSCNYK